jgi:formylglycine-generating enzyme required for sulfatase activity
MRLTNSGCARTIEGGSVAPYLQAVLLTLLWYATMTFPLALLTLLPLFILMVALPGFATDAETVVVKLDHQLASNEMASMVLIPAGQFTMGRDDAVPDEQPTHRVSLDAFYIDRYEVTVAQYAKFVESEDSEPPFLWQEARRGPNDENPVLGVDWHDAAAYCRWAGKRLPAEAEWEKAARGTDGRIYPWGNDPPTPAHANFGHETTKGYAALAKVGSFEKGKSPYGVYDLAGNVWEWVADRYDEHYYQHSPEQNPRGPTTGPLRALRGGAWNSAPTVLASTNRNANVPSARRSDVGFRCAQDAPK